MLVPLVLAAFLAAPVAPDVKLSTAPAEVLLVPGAAQQVSFDILVDNGGSEAIELSRIEVSAWDATDRLLLRRFMSGNGFSPALLTVLPEREVKAGARGMIFNPFFTFPSDAIPARLHYRLDFERSSGEQVRAELDVPLHRFTGATALRLPLAVRTIVDDGADFYGHHRRMQLTHPIAQALGFRRNFMRYALDLVAVDAAGAGYRNGGSKNEDWFGWRSDVLAPAAGRVVALHSDQIDNDTPGRENHFDERRVMEDPMALYGNYVVLDHGNGEFSMLAHLEKDSVAVEKGQAVKSGQKLARVGSSGSSIYPHLHYELRRAAGLDTEGLPVEFTNLVLVRGAAKRAAGRHSVETGDIVEPGRR